jgi:multidrug efflux pump
LPSFSAGAGSIEELLLQDVGNGALERTLTRVPTAYTSADVNSGLVQVSMTDWKDRNISTAGYMQTLAPKLAALPGVRAIATQRRGFRARGAQQPLQFVISGPSYEELAQWRNRLMDRIARENPGIQRLESDFEETKPTLAIDVDLNRAADMGVSVEAISRTLETILGGRRVTTFNEGGREYDVILQAGIKQRSEPADLESIYVRSDAGAALNPLANLISTHETAGPASYNRVDRMRSITLSANLAQGYALSEAIAYVERVVREELPSTARLSYAGQSRELKESSGALSVSFGLALLVVFLVLAAQFESWVHPLVIMTTVPLAVFGALAALATFGFTLNIYSQIGIIMLVGLAAKNGILIVDFANQRREAGAPLREALLEAAALRLRPILMTSLATAAGIVPLMLASGAGSEARTNLGLVVFWGVIFATALTLFVVPAFYLLFAARTHSPRHTAAKLEEQEAKEASENELTVEG